jgi:hypothetical protein
VFGSRPAAVAGNAGLNSVCASAGPPAWARRAVRRARNESTGVTVCRAERYWVMNPSTGTTAAAGTDTAATTGDLYDGSNGTQARPVVPSGAPR